MVSTEEIDKKLAELAVAKGIVNIERIQVPTEYGWMNAQSYAHQVLSTGGEESTVLAAIDTAAASDYSER